MIRPEETLLLGLNYFMRYEERITASNWCTRNLYLPAGKQETKPGPVSFEDRPYMIEPIDCVNDPTVTDCLFAAPTRIGKTFVLRMVWSYSIGADPASMMWVDSTIDKGRDISRKELQPLVKANKILRDRKPKDSRHNYTDLRMLFPGAAFSIVGGNSPAGVAGDTVKRVLGNELDKWEGETEMEASVAELVRHRTESFDDERKHFWSSTPTLETMTTWRYYLRGDQRRYMVRCPDCGAMQAMEWKNVIWDLAAQISEGRWDLRRVKESARYKCEKCLSPWDDRMRKIAIRHPDHHWLATAIGEPGWRSYHINGLYGPLKANNVGELAADFLSSRQTGFFADRRDFWNSRMGLPWKDDVGDITVDKFSKLERNYHRGEPGPAGFKPDVMIIGFDVQTNRLPYIVRVFNWAGESYLVDHGDAATWSDLQQVQDDYRKFGLTSYVIGDINFEDRRAETLEQIYMRQNRGWYGAEGFEQTKDIVKLEQAPVFLGGRLQKQGHVTTKLVISTYDFKVELEKRFTGEISNWFTYELAPDATDQEREEQKELYTQYADERRVPRKRPVAGKPPMEFRSRNKNNHFADSEVYALALFWVLSKRRTYAARKQKRKEVEVTSGS